MAAYRALKMAQKLAGDAEHSCGAVLAAVEVAVASVVGKEAVMAYRLLCKRDMVLEELNLVDSANPEVLYAP